MIVSKKIKLNFVFYFLASSIFIFMVVNIDVIFSIQANQITDRNNYHTHVQDGKTWFLYILNIGFPLFNIADFKTCFQPKKHIFDMF